MLRTISLFILLIAGVLLAGSLAAYPMHIVLSPVTGLGFHKFVHYTILLGALGLGLYYLKASGQARQVFGRDLPGAKRRRTFINGLLLGLLILLVVECCLLALGMRQQDPRLLDEGIAGFLYTVIKALMTGLVVGLLEETLYRGAVFSGLQKYANTVTAVICSSLLYAAVHFIEFDDVPADAVINPLDGVHLLLSGFYMFKDPLIYDSFVTLFVLGVLFCLVRIGTGSIIACMGLHAGIVAMNKIMNYSTDFKPGSAFEFLVNSYDRLNGWLASICLIISCLLYFYVGIKKGPPLQN